MIGVYILAKNEAVNLPRLLESLSNTDWRVYVLDSGSTDETRQVTVAYPNVRVVSHSYIDHCTSYNEILANYAIAYEAALVLDADMIISERLREKLNYLVQAPRDSWDVLRAPVEMYVEGRSLGHGSLYPPKCFAFRTGRRIFVASGHGETLVSGLKVLDVVETLIHDDRKPYVAFLASQVRYAFQLLARAKGRDVSRRDKLRMKSPLLVMAVPFVSFIVKGGFWHGRVGLIYALDRLIAEAIMYRQSLAESLAQSDNLDN